MKYLLIALCFLFSTVSIAQKTSLADMLWKEAGGRIDISADNGGAYEIIDDAKNGYLQVAFTEDGCGCYYETTVAAYKDAKGGYTTLKMEWDACGNRKTFSTNKDLASILPANFGISAFIPNSKKLTSEITSAVFYLQAEIPRKGTATKLHLRYIPIGIQMSKEKGVLKYGFNRDGNYKFMEGLYISVHGISDENTLNCVLEQSIGHIIPKDKIVIQELYGENKAFSNLNELEVQLRQLKNIYNLSKAIEYKSIILEWNRKEARFFIKEKIKNDTPQQSFLEFLKQLPFLMATC